MPHSPFLARMVLVMLLIASGLLIVFANRSDDPVASIESDVIPQDHHLALAAVSRRIARETAPSVVRVEARRTSRTTDEQLVHLFGDDHSELQSQGSGVCVAPQIVLTNYHVVAHAKEVIVKTHRQQATAMLVGFDALTDLAVLQVRGMNLPVAKWGDSDDLAAGDFVWAVGNPFGLEQSVTFGIVSAINQKNAGADVLQEFMQTDAAVNPGGSGGPLVDTQGRIVGINTAILGHTFRGISFAIPSNTAQLIAKELATTGEIRRGWLGVVTETVGGQSAPEGARVTAFAGKPGTPSPARTTGIQIGDLIVRWNELNVTSAVQLARLAAQTKPQSQVKITILRGGEELNLLASISARP